MIARQVKWEWNPKRHRRRQNGKGNRRRAWSMRNSSIKNKRSGDKE